MHFAQDREAVSSSAMKVCYRYFCHQTEEISHDKKAEEKILESKLFRPLGAITGSTFIL